jgi:hypothetical protein
VTGTRRLTRTGLLAALGCALRGHRWESSPAANGVVIVLCDRCRELVIAPFVDESTVLGLEDGAGECWLGTTWSSRVAVDLVAALLSGSEENRLRLRRMATARPGDAVDALAQLAAVLCGMVTPARPQAALHAVADRVELSVLQLHLTAGSHGGDA